MKGAIASVEVFARREGDPVRRLTLVVGTPTRSDEGWLCRVALADRHPPESLSGADSVEVLGLALARGRRWLALLRAEGFSLSRDRAGQIPYPLD